MENGSKPATQGDLQAVKSELKADVQAVKNDLQVAKSELKADVQAVKNDLQVAKSELKADMTRLAVELAKTNGRIDNLGRTINEKIDRNTEKVLGAIADFAAKAEMYDRKAFSHEDALATHTKQLSEHDKRLKVLEGKP